jgi:hypothetical protein
MSLMSGQRRKRARGTYALERAEEGRVGTQKGQRSKQYSLSGKGGVGDKPRHRNDANGMKVTHELESPKGE